MPSFAKPWSVPALILVQENCRTPSATWSTTSCGRFATPVEGVANKSGLACSVCGTSLSKPCPWMFPWALGRSTALFYAKSQLQETGATIGLNQTDVMATAFTDHYFHLRAIYQGFWGSEQPRVPTSWNPMLVEIGAGFAPTHRVKFIGAVAVVPGAEQSAQDWQFDAWEQGVDQSVTEITDVKASTQFVLGAQLRIGSTMWGFEQRWFSFLGDTREYILTGASNTSTPSYFCMNIGWQF